MLRSVFQGDAPGLNLDNLKVAEGLVDGDGICPLRCLVLQDSACRRFAVGYRSEKFVGDFIFRGRSPAKWTEQIIVDNYLIEVVAHRVL